MTSEKDSKEEEFVFEFYDEDYAESLEEEISRVEEIFENELISADPEILSQKISGVSSKKVTDWQNSAKALLKT